MRRKGGNRKSDRDDDEQVNSSPQDFATLPNKDKKDYSYSWVILSSPYYNTLTILARDVSIFYTRDRQYVLGLLPELGFKNAPYLTYQGKDCTYPIFAPL